MVIKIIVANRKQNPSSFDCVIALKPTQNHSKGRFSKMGSKNIRALVAGRRKGTAIEVL